MHCGKRKYGNKVFRLKNKCNNKSNDKTNIKKTGLKKFKYYKAK